MSEQQTIVLADDEVHILRVLELKLSAAGFHCIKAVNGQLAWELVQRHQPVLVISDYQMPEVDGVELAERMHRESSLCEIPVILLTARGFSLHREDLARTNIVHKIAKPFSPREILSLVQEVLAGSVKGG